MTPESRSGVKRHVAERFCLRRRDDVPHIDAHGVVDHLELIHHGDVHRPENILGEFDRLGHPTVGDGHKRINGATVEGAGVFQACRSVAANHLRNPGNLG